MTRSLVVVPLLVLTVAAACASGPSDDAIARNLTPSTTTTTEPLPEGIALIKITNASFQPAVLELDTATVPVVRWENLDDVEYVILSRDRVEDATGARVPLFESPPLPPGATWDFDFSALEPAVYRYFITRGAQTIPGLVETRPEQ